MLLFNPELSLQLRLLFLYWLDALRLYSRRYGTTKDGIPESG